MTKENKIAGYIPNEYYWVLTKYYEKKYSWEVVFCEKANHYPEKICFTMMGVGGGIMRLKEIIKSIHIPFPEKIDGICMCELTCPKDCKGQCGCKKCYQDYNDFLSLE